MIKFRLYFDKDKETEWINKLAAEGLSLTGFFAGFYNFEKCDPGKYTYQIDFGEKFFAVTDSYREFMEENNIEIVQTWGYWIILRKHTSDDKFKLYTDVDSSIEHYSKIKTMFKIVTIIELICFIMECLAAAAGNNWAVFFATLIGILVLVLLRAVVNTNHIINELKERKGEAVSECEGKVSPILTCGLLLNCCAMTISESVSPYIKAGLHIFAIILMLVGLFQSRNIFKE